MKNNITQSDSSDKATIHTNSYFAQTIDRHDDTDFQDNDHITHKYTFSEKSKNHFSHRSNFISYPNNCDFSHHRI